MANRTEYKNQWLKENRDTKLLTLLKGRKAEIQAAADAEGESMNDFITKAIDERMARLERCETECDVKNVPDEREDVL